jgi:hypothetical protein
VGKMWYLAAMVNSLGDKNRAAAGEYTAVRIPAPIKRQLERAAGANRKSLSAEIVARLAQSLDMGAPEIDPGEIPTSPIAREALALARRNEARIKAVEDALCAICSEDAYLDCLNGPAQDLLQGILNTLPPKGT